MPSIDYINLTHDLDLWSDLWVMVMIYLHGEDKGQRSGGSKARVDTNAQTEMIAFALPYSIMQSVTNGYSIASTKPHHPLKWPFSRGMGPHLIYGSLAPLSPYPKLHPIWFSRFYIAYQCVQQMHTDRDWPRYICASRTRPYQMLCITLWPNGVSEMMCSQMLYTRQGGCAVTCCRRSVT